MIIGAAARKLSALELAGSDQPAHVVANRGIGLLGEVKALQDFEGRNAVTPQMKEELLLTGWVWRRMGAAFLCRHYQSS